SILELSSDLDLSQSSQKSTQQPPGFSTPATSQGFLDSSTAKHRRALNSRKLKRRKTISLSLRAKQEEQHLLLATKEKATIKQKQADRKDQGKESTGPSSQEQSYKTETQAEKTGKQTLSTDGNSSTGNSTPGSQQRRRRRRPKTEWEMVERTLLKCAQEHDRVIQAESSTNEEFTGRDYPYLKLFMEKQGIEMITTAQAPVTTPQEMSADKRDVKGEMAAKNIEVQRRAAPQPTPTNVAASMVSGPPPRHEEGSSEGMKKRDRAALSSWLKNSSTSQEEAAVPRTVEVQACVHVSQVHGEKEAASSLGLQKFQPKMDNTAYHRERHARGSLQAFSASVSSATAEKDVSRQRLPLPIRRWPTPGEISSNSKSTSEYESSCEGQLGPAQSLQLAWTPQDDDDVFLKSENVGAELRKLERQPPLSYCSQSFGKPRSRDVSIDPDGSDQRSCEEMTSAHSSQSVEEFKECSEAKTFVIDSVSQGQLAPRRQFQALQESEERDVSTESSSYVEKYHSSDDLSSIEEEQPPEHSKETQGQFRDQQEVSPVSKSAPKESSLSAKPLRPMHASLSVVSPITQQQRPISTNISVGQNRSVRSLPLSHTVKSLVRPQSDHQMFSDPEGTAANRDVHMQSVSPRKALKYPVWYNVGQNVSSTSDISTIRKVAPTEVLRLRCHSQPPIRPILKQDISAGPKVAASKERIPSQLPRYPSQPSVRPNIKKEISLGVESASFKESHFMEPLPPKHRSQPPLKPFIQQQPSAFERGVSMDSRLLAHRSQTRTKPQGKQSFSTPESTASKGKPSVERVPPTLSKPMQRPYQNVPLESKPVAAKIISVDPLHTKYSAQSLPNPQSQPASESTSVEGANLVELLPPQPSVKPKFQPQMTQDPARASTQCGSLMEPISVQRICQTQANPKFKQVPTGPDNPEAQGSISMQPGSPRCPSQSSLTPTFEQLSVPSGNVPAACSTPSYLPAPRMLSQPLMGSVVKQPVSTELVSISAPQSSSVELIPSSFPVQSRVDPESYTAEEGISVRMRPGRYHSQPPISTGFKEEVSTDSVRASGECGIPIKPMLSKYATQPWLDPEFEQQTSSLEGFAKEGDISKEAWVSRNPSQIIVKHQLQKAPSSFESTSVEGGSSGKPLPPKGPTPSLMRSTLQEMPSGLESAAQDSSKTPQDSSSPAPSFVKFMAKQIFSENTDSERDIYTKSMLQRRSRPPRSLLKPKLQEQPFFYNWDDEPKEDTALKTLPTNQLSQSPRRPEEPQEVLPYSEGVLVKWSSSAVDISQPLGKLEDSQKASVSVSFPQEWPRSEEQLPSSQPSQAFDVAVLQAPILSTGSANVPVEWSSLEGHWAPGQPTQAVLVTDYQQQVYLSSANAAAAEGTISQNTGSWSMPKGLDSPKKTMKYTHGYGDLIQSTPTSPKTGRLTVAPAQKAFPSTGTYSEEEVIQDRDGNESPSILSTSKADVENVFGVRLRSIPQKSESENLGPFMQVVPAGKEWMNKGAPQDFSGGLEEVSQTLSFAEKQDNRPRYEGPFKKPGVYRPPVCRKGRKENEPSLNGIYVCLTTRKDAIWNTIVGNLNQTDDPFCPTSILILFISFSGKTSNWKAYHTTEPAWINVAKQRQKGFLSHFTKKTKTRAEIKTETKEPRYESKHGIPVKEKRNQTLFKSATQIFTTRGACVVLNGQEEIRSMETNGRDHAINSSWMEHQHF
ncbi:hypothetical protein A6R68_02654, partial [Neotoma lepida]